MSLNFIYSIENKGGGITIVYLFKVSVEAVFRDTFPNIIDMFPNPNEQGPGGSSHVL